MPTWVSKSIARARASARDRLACALTASSSWSPMFSTGFSAVIGSWKIMASCEPRSDCQSELLAARMLPSPRGW